MRPVGEVRVDVLARVRPTGSEQVSLEEAVGRYLGEEVIAPHDVPSFSNSAMDGFAVRSADVTVAGAVLEIVEGLAAGQTTSVVVGPGQAVKIMTGAPMPDGADAVVPVEDTEVEEDKVRVTATYEPGSSVRSPGGDVRAGATVFTPGTLISAAHIGVLATIGVTNPTVAKRPRVAVMSTGDELVPASTPVLEPGMIRDSNRPMLHHLVRAAGGEPVDLGRIPDDAESFRAALGQAAAEADVIVTSGGVSMGEYDVTKLVLRDEADVDFYPVAMKPGKPQGFGTVGGKLFFGLPGNPVSVFVSFEQFVRPALLSMQGATDLLRPRVHGVAGQDFESDPAKEEFLRVRFASGSPELEVTASGGQGSHVISAAANADAFAVMPVGVERVAKGEKVILELFRAESARRSEDV